MEIIGWITIILLCTLALTFIIVELGPVIHTEISSWSIRKKKALEAKEEKSKFKTEMKNLKREAKKLKYMKKTGLIIPNDLYEEEVNNINNIDNTFVEENKYVEEENNLQVFNINTNDIPHEEESPYMPTDEELNLFEIKDGVIDNDINSDSATSYAVEEITTDKNVDTQNVEVNVNVKKIRSKKKNNE